tara:strand:- start:557 stop:1522 length:966 start_codon:yes stop_codon:yes gene_type:complete
LEQRKIIIDCDPGHDDAVAILLALASPKDIDVLGITCVAGNVPLTLTTRNALSICELAGRTDANVYGGCSKPMFRPLVTAEYVHGSSGLDLDDGATLPCPTMCLEAQHAVPFIVETVMTQPPNSVTLCLLGPLTNIATAFGEEPAIISRIQEIILMGGAAISPGNVTPSAEFNMYVDPEAADIIFRSGAPITMMGLDVTHQVLITEQIQERIRNIGSTVSTIVADLMSFYCRFDLERYGMLGGPLHDPCVIGHVIDDEIFNFKEINVMIEKSSALTRGETVSDWWQVTDRPINCKVAESVNTERFFNLLIERISNFPIDQL